jgi:molybdopterin/thiamine biosynthesis adenylyltransferase
MPGVGRVTLVDRDTYEGRNLVSQDILACDVGIPKARVQARRLRRINPDLHVTAVVGAVEDLPLGSLRADVILAALDSLRPRQCVNETAWRLGVPWCDSGVRGQDLLARVAVYFPGEDAPCIECAWSDLDYAQIEQVYPCQDPRNPGPAPTNAPSCLGALAASMLALECRKVLEGQLDRVAVGRQVVVDAQWHHHYVTRYRHNPGCRFDHRTWRIEKLHCRLDRFTVRDALRLGDRIELERMPFITRLVCPGCGLARRLLFLAPALPPASRKCAGCGAAMTATGFDLLERLDGLRPRSVLRRSLRSVGLRAGDVFHAGNGKHYEIESDDS